MNNLHVISIGKKSSNAPTGIFLHGFGSTNENVAPLCYEFLDVIPHWLVIRAPIPLEPLSGFEGYAWFPRNKNELLYALTGPLWSELSEYDTPDLEYTSTYLDECLHEYGVENQNIVLAGFSQGGMVASEYALRCMSQNNIESSIWFVKALLLFSSSLVALNRWQRLSKIIHADTLRDLCVYISHGIADQILTYKQGSELYRFWKDLVPSTSLYSFEGEHEIPHNACENACTLLRTRL